MRLVFILLLSLASCGPPDPPFEPVALDVPSWLDPHDCDATAVFLRKAGGVVADPVGSLRAVASCRTLASGPGPRARIALFDVFDHPGLRDLARVGRHGEAALGAVDVIAGCRAMAQAEIDVNMLCAAIEERALEVLIGVIPHLDADTRRVTVARLHELDRAFPGWDPSLAPNDPYEWLDTEERHDEFELMYGARSSDKVGHQRLEHRWSALRAVIATTAPRRVS